jgi:hypothetical protein
VARVIHDFTTLATNKALPIRTLLDKLPSHYLTSGQIKGLVWRSYNINP